MDNQHPRDIPAQLKPLLRRSIDDNRFIVVMNCGIAGSGKTTLAKEILRQFPTFKRLSVDELVADSHGLYGVDYPADEVTYAVYLEEASMEFEQRFQNLLRTKHDMILDRSFYAKSDRTIYRTQIEEAGGRPVLVYFKPADNELLWARIQERSRAERDANSAFDISREIFERYCEGFDVPSEEGEVIVDII